MIGLWIEKILKIIWKNFKKKLKIFKIKFQIKKIKLIIILKVLIKYLIWKYNHLMSN